MIFIFSTTALFCQKKDCIKKWDSITDSEVYEAVDIMPQPIEGLGVLHNQIRKTIKIDSIPSEILSIKAAVAFVVCPNGGIVGERILNDNTDNVSAQLLSAIKKVQWQAGICNNDKVAVLYRLPLIACFR